MDKNIVDPILGGGAPVAPPLDPPLDWSSLYNAMVTPLLKFAPKEPSKAIFARKKKERVGDKPVTAT